MWHTNLCLSPVWVVSEGTAQPRLPSSEERHRPAPRWESSERSEPEPERKRNQEPGPRPGWGDIRGAGGYLGGDCLESQLHRGPRSPDPRVWEAWSCFALLPVSLLLCWFRAPWLFFRTELTGSLPPAVQGTHPLSGRAFQILSQV